MKRLAQNAKRLPWYLRQSFKRLQAAFYSGVIGAPVIRYIESEIERVIGDMEEKRELIKRLDLHYNALRDALVNEPAGDYAMIAYLNLNHTLLKIRVMIDDERMS